jgi:hypothetical protein
MAAHFFDVNILKHVLDGGAHCFFLIPTSRNVNIYDDLVVTFHLFVMEVVSTANFVTSSQIMKLRGWSLNNEPVSS